MTILKCLIVLLAISSAAEASEVFFQEKAGTDRQFCLSHSCDADKMEAELFAKCRNRYSDCVTIEKVVEETAFKNDPIFCGDVSKYRCRVRVFGQTLTTP